MIQSTGTLNQVLQHAGEEYLLNDVCKRWLIEASEQEEKHFENDHLPYSL